MKFMIFIENSPEMTGAPKRLISLVEGLALLGWRYTIYLYGDGVVNSYLRDRGINFHEVPLPAILTRRNRALVTFNPFKILFYAFRFVLFYSNFASVLRKGDESVALIRGTKGVVFFLVPLLLSRKRVVWDIDSEPKGWVFSIIRIMALGGVDKLVLQYGEVLGEIYSSPIIKRIADGKSVTITPGIHIPDRKHCSESPERSSFSIVHVGTICARKNQLFTINLANRLVNDYGMRDLQVVMLGGYRDKVYFKECTDLVAKLDLVDVVHFAGWCDSIIEKMLFSDCIVIPSTEEGMPNTLQEAMAIGLPVFCSEAGGMKEVVQHGYNGFIYNSFDFVDWATDVNGIYRDRNLRKRVSQNSISYSDENFSISGWVESYSKVMKSVI